MKLTKSEAQLWRQSTIYNLGRLNAIVGNEFTGENYYSLSFRGKNHHPVLLLDNQIVARGIFNINYYLYNLLRYYHLI